MGLFLKRLLLALAILLPSLLLAAQIGVARLTFERVRPVLERDLGAIVGLDVRIHGEIRANLLPRLQLDLYQVEVENFSGRPSDRLLAIRHVGLEIRLLPLLRNHVVFEGIEIDGVDLRVETDEQGRWGFRPDLDALDEVGPGAAEDPIRFEIRRLSVYDLQVSFDPDGLSPIETLSVDALTLTAASRHEPMAVSARGRFEGGVFDVVAELGSPAELAASTHPFPVHLEANVIDGWIEIVGHLDDPSPLGGLDLRIEALLMDPAERAHELGLELPPLGSFRLTGRLVEREGTLGLEDLLVRSRGDGPIDLDLGGRVGRLRAFEAIDLDVDLQTKDPTFLARIAPIPIPRAQLLTSLHLDDRGGRLGVEGEVALDDPGTLAAHAAGRIDDLLTTPKLDAGLELEATNLTGFVQDLGLGRLLPKASLGPVRASGRLVGGDGRLGIESIEMRVGRPEMHHARIRGAITDLLGLEGVDLDGQVFSHDVRALAEHFGHDVPAIGGLEASFSLVHAAEALALEDVVFELGRAGAYSARASGRVRDLRNRRGIDIETAVFLRDLAPLAELFDAELPERGPVEYRARVRGSLDALRSTGTLRVRDTLFDGEFNRFAPDGRRAKIEFSAHSPLVHLGDLLTPLPAGATGRLRPPIRPDFDLEAWWSGKSRLPLDGLRAFDAEIRLAADRLVGTELLEIEELRLHAGLAGGMLSIDEAVARYASGGVSARLDIDARESHPLYRASLEAFNVDTTLFMRQFREETDYAGLLDLSIDVSTSGATQREFRSNLDGRFGAMLRDGALVGAYARSFTFDLLRVSIPDLSFGKGEKAPVQCMLVLFPIEGGMAELDTFYIEGRDVTIRGTGRVDLVRDAYDLRLKPELHKPGLVSVAATVQVAGPLDAPVFQPLSGSMFTSAMGALLRNSLRPLKAIDRLLRWRSAGDDEDGGGPCDAVVRHRVEQLQSPDVEPIDLEEVVARRLVAREEASATDE